LLSLGAFLLALRNDAPLIAAPLASIWNPDITILPFGALVVAAALLGSGRLAMFPVVVVLHAFVTQTHVAYAVPATLAAAVGMGWAFREARTSQGAPDPEAAPHRSWLWSGLALAALCWCLPAVDLWWGRGNLAEIVEFFWRRDPPVTSWSEALEYAGNRLSQPMFPLADPVAPGSEGSMIPRHLAAALLPFGLAASIWRALRHRARFELVLATSLLLQLLVLIPLLAQLGPRDPRYLSEWTMMLTTLAVIAVAITWLAQPTDRLRSAALAGFCAAVLAITLAAHVERAVQRLPAAADHFAAITADIVRIAEIVAPHARSGATALAADESALATFAGVVCLLYKERGDLVLQDTPRIRNLFGRGFAYRGASPAWIVLSASRRDDGELLARGQRVWVYRLAGPARASSTR
jgi:hypothetical protein